MRAVAVGAVVLYHAGLSVVPGGYVGVDIFFVISGFLITGQLISMLEAKGRIPFGEFYAKRIRRIIPASFVVLALTTVASLVFLPPATRPGALQDAIATALYVPNVLFAAQGADYLAETAPSPFQHYWSLGVEEQFYLFWPLLLLLGFLLVRRSTRRLFWVVLSIVVLSFALCLVLTGTSQPAAFFLLPTRAWELGIGALAAFALHSGLVRLNGRLAALGTWLGMAGIAVSLIALNESTVFPGWAALLPVLSTAAVIVCGSNLPSGGAGMVLSRAPMQQVGAWSYSIYLVHWPLLVIPQAAVGYENPLPLSLTLALGALSVPLAVLLYKYVENRFRHPAAGSPLRSRRVIATAALASLAFVAVAAGVNAVQSTAPIASTRDAASQPLQVAPNGSSFVPANLNPTLRDAPDSIPGTYDDGCHADFPATAVRTDCVYGDPDGTVDIVLFGDSHAAQWFPALEAYAADGSYRLHNLTKSSCPSVDIEILHEQRPYSQCEEWRQSALEYIDELDPAVVLLSNFGEVAPVDTSTGLVEQWEAGLRSTLAALPGSSHALVLADTPNHSASPLDCLSRNTEEAAACDLPRAEALDGEIIAAEERAVREGNSSFIDLSSYLCTEICPSIIGDLLVYRDEHHITTTFSRALAGPLGEEIDRVR